MSDIRRRFVAYKNQPLAGKSQGENMLWLLKVVAFLIMVGGVGSWFVRWGLQDVLKKDYEERQREFEKRHNDWERYYKGTQPEPQPPKAPPAGMPRFRWHLTISIIGLVTVIALSGAAMVPATHTAVVENTWTGEFYSLGPGTHVWPFAKELTPLVSKVTMYDLRRQIIEIGGAPAAEKGVQADSSSPGRPVVYFWARGWAYPNKDNIIELHRRYGPAYLDDWVERVWVSSLKGIQGERPFDFVGKYRVQFQDIVEQALQEQLLGVDNEPLVFVSQLAIVDFDFSQEVNDYLDQVAQKEFERQTAEQQIEVNRKNQDAAKIQAETDYLVKVRAAEATKQDAIIKAEGDAQGKKTMADAIAYETFVKYKAEADGIALVQTVLSQAPEGYLEYQRTKTWDGKLPTYMMGGVLPFLDVTPKE